MIEGSAQDDWQQAGFALYLHWPFCQAKCPYCDFNSHVAQAVNQRRWLAAYLHEIDRIGAETAGRLLRSVFFGGGTPSLMDPEIVGAILDRIRRTWRVANDWEVTLEANPSSVEAGRLAAYCDSGVNRVSLGLQALNDTDLRRLGRLHSVKEALHALDVAKRCVNRVSFDLIYARQDQTPGEWRQELAHAIALGTDHLSLYQLTIESGTAFHDRLSRGLLKGLPNEDRSVTLHEITQELCGTAGLPAYEISNHARPGQESRHNLTYWQAGDYAAIGPGAHGRMTLDGTRWATEAVRAPQVWLHQVESSGHGETPRESMSPLARAEEFLIMGLRLKTGVNLDRLSNLSGYSINPDEILSLCDLGLVQQTGGLLRATEPGAMLLNSVIANLASALTPELSRKFV